MTLKSFSPMRSRQSGTLSVEDLQPTLGSGRDNFERVIPLAHYIWLLRKHLWRLFLIVFICSATAYVVASRITPIYESTTRIVIDLKSSSNIVGEATEQTTSGSEADQLFNTQLQLIQSDAVLRPVADRFHLLLSSKSLHSLPGGMMAADAPVYLPGLSVVHPVNSFLININYRSTNPVEAAALANAIAHSYISRQIEMRVHSSMEESSFMEKQIAELKGKMDSSASALSGYERQLGVINPEEKTSIVAGRLMQLNTQYTDSQNDRINKEADFRAFQKGSLAAIQVSPQASALSRIEDAVRAAEQKMEATKTIYGSNNSEYKRNASELAAVSSQYGMMKLEIGKRIEVEFQEALARENMLRASLLQAKYESDTLNAHSIEYQELKREAEANKNLYGELFRKVTEAAINGAFQGSAIRIADEARPQPTPTFPNKAVFVLISFLCSSTLSLAAILLLDILDNSLRDPGQVRRELETEVLGVLPYIVNSDGLMPGPSDHFVTEAVQWTSDKWFSTKISYEEAINTLLSSLFSYQSNTSLHSILITSAHPGEGKSSCIAHMAYAHAKQGYRTLLIDADLRCPSIQQMFRLTSGFGLSDAILHGTSLHDLRRQVEGNPNLQIVTAGSNNQHVYTHVSRTVHRFLAEAKNEYDVVFIDAPPMLCFAEPLQLAAMVDGVLVVNLAGVTSRRVVSDLLVTLRRISANQLGIILNCVKHSMSVTYEPYSHYHTHRALPGNI